MEKEGKRGKKYLWGAALLNLTVAALNFQIGGTFNTVLGVLNTIVGFTLLILLYLTRERPDREKERPPQGN